MKRVKRIDRTLFGYNCKEEGKPDRAYNYNERNTDCAGLRHTGRGKKKNKEETKADR